MKLYLYTPERKLFIREEEWLSKTQPNEHVFMEPPVNSTWIAPSSKEKGNVFFNEKTQQWINYPNKVSFVNSDNSLDSSVDSDTDPNEWQRLIKDLTLVLSTPSLTKRLKEFYNWYYINEEWVQKPQSNIKIDISKRIQYIRNSFLGEGFKYKNYILSGNEESQNILNTFLVKESLEIQNYPIIWRNKDNINFEISNKIELKELGQLMNNFVQQVYKKSWDIKDSIKDLSEEETIKKYTIYKDKL